MTDDTDPRASAIKRIKGKRDFYQHLFIYLAVNAVLVVVWFVGGRDGGFWPAWVILGWGIGVAVHAWNVFGPGERPISEDEIQREIDRGQQQRG